jgi:hypothetical protein
MKSTTIFWDVTPCTLAEVHQSFGGTSQSLLPAGWLHGLLLDTIKIQAAHFSEMLMKFTRLHGITFQNTEHFQSVISNSSE